MRCVLSLKKALAFLRMPIAAAGGKLLPGEFNQNGILSDALDVTPGNDQLILLLMAEKSAVPWYDQ